MKAKNKVEVQRNFEKVPRKAVFPGVGCLGHPLRSVTVTWPEAGQLHLFPPGDQEIIPHHPEPI